MSCNFCKILEKMSILEICIHSITFAWFLLFWAALVAPWCLSSILFDASRCPWEAPSGAEWAPGWEQRIAWGAPEVISHQLGSPGALKRLSKVPKYRSHLHQTHDVLGNVRLVQATARNRTLQAASEPQISIAIGVRFDLDVTDIRVYHIQLLLPRARAVSATWLQHYPRTF